MTNPWDVDSLQAFLTLKCPECDFCTDTETLFQAHAVANHPLCLGNLLKRIDKFLGAALKGDNNFSWRFLFFTGYISHSKEGKVGIFF